MRTSTKKKTQYEKYDSKETRFKIHTPNPRKGATQTHV